MRDPYDILGVSRGATFDEVKAAYRRACKTKHPDLGGSHEAFIELQSAYEQILRDLKHGYQQRRQKAPRGDHAHARESADAQRDRRAEQMYRDIEEELEELRRAAESAAKRHDEALRARRTEAWEAGHAGTWAKLTWQDIAGFFSSIARSGLKGLSLLFAALVGVGTVLVEANVVSAFVLAGSGLGFALSLALKSDKGGLMSAGLLLFGLMTVWLPPVRAALFGYPVATISVLLCLALILKFAQQGGTAGLLTGGVLALYVLGVVITDTRREVATLPPSRTSQPPTTIPSGPAQRVPDVAVAPPTRGAPPTRPPSTVSAPPTAAPAATPPRATVSPAPPARPVLPTPPAEPRTLLASDGAVLKFVAGVPYRLKIRSGAITTLNATEGQVALYSGVDRVRECSSALVLRSPDAARPYEELTEIVRACNFDALIRVAVIRHAS
jgi:hypothetical protein